MLRQSLVFIVFLATSAAGLSQNIKSLDYAGVFAKNKVCSRTCVEIIYEKGIAHDTLPVMMEKFDAKGRITHCTEFFARGRKLAEYFFYYNESGLLDSNMVCIAFDDFKPQSFILKRDTKSRVIERTLTEPNPNFWCAEQFTYNEYGIMVKSIKRFGEEESNSMVETYQPTIKPNEKSLSYLHDQHGLPVVFRIFDGSGTISRVMKWEYEVC